MNKNALGAILNSCCIVVVAAVLIWARFSCAGPIKQKFSIRHTVEAVKFHLIWPWINFISAYLAI